MLILFDHGTPKGLARALPGHTVVKAQARGWDRLQMAHCSRSQNSELSSIADNREQNPLPAEPCRTQIAIVVLTGSTKWSRVRLHLERVATAVDAAAPGSYAEVEIPFG